MNLGKVYKKIFEGRKKDYFETLNEAPMYSMGAPSKDASPNAEVESLDIEYYSDQLNKLFTELEEFHQELGTNIEMSYEKTGNYEYETMEKQVSRYIMGATKQIESLQKYIERQKGKGL